MSSSGRHKIVQSGVKHLESGWKAYAAGTFIVMLVAGLLGLLIGTTGGSAPLVQPVAVMGISRADGGGGGTGPTSQATGPTGGPAARTATVATSVGSACATNLSVRVARTAPVFSLPAKNH